MTGCELYGFDSRSPVCTSGAARDHVGTCLRAGANHAVVVRAGCRRLPGNGSGDVATVAALRAAFASRTFRRATPFHIAPAQWLSGNSPMVVTRSQEMTPREEIVRPPC